MFDNNNNNNNNNSGKGIFWAIAEKANKTTNSEKAKTIRKHLIGWGAAGVAIGAILVISGFIYFISMMSSDSFDVPVAGFVLFIIGGFVLTVSSGALSAGVKIAIVGVGSNIIDASDKCPKCGDTVTEDEAFCDKCGTPLLKATLCDCGKQNDVNSAYCKACGKRLR